MVELLGGARGKGLQKFVGADFTIYLMDNTPRTI
jgi:hypothetical protein